MLLTGGFKGRMTLGFNYTSRFLTGKVSQTLPQNAQKAEQLGIDTSVKGQLLDNYAAFYSDKSQFEAIYQKNHTITSAQKQQPSMQAQTAIQEQASIFAKQAATSVQQVEFDRIESKIGDIQSVIVQAILAQIEMLKGKCYQGNFTCFKALIDISEGKINILNNNFSENLDLSEVFQRAHKAIEELVKDSSSYPELLSMIISSNLVSASQHSELADGPAKLMNMAAGSNSAMEKLKNLMNKGQIRLEDFAERAIALDPSSAIHVMSRLATSSKSKSETLSIVNILSKVATEQTGTNAGGQAAKALGKIIKTHSDQGIVKAAFTGLKKSAMAGNTNSLKMLEKLAKDPTISFNKAAQAIECLTEIGKSSSGSSGEATNMLIGIAKDKKLSPKLRMKSVDGLTEISATGGANSGKASDVLLDFAKNPAGPVGHRALVNILKLNNTDHFDQQKLAGVMHSAARNSKVSPKLKLAAYNKLENIFDKNAAGAGEAMNSIVNLARHGQGEIKMRARNKLSKQNSSNLSKEGLRVKLSDKQNGSELKHPATKSNAFNSNPATTKPFSIFQMA
jgi:hypothetical protein